MADALRPTPQATALPARRSWSLPILRELPKLTDLTLASAIGGTGGTGGSGSTVFGILLAVGLLVSACSGDQSMEPSVPAIAPAVASISCTGDVATKVISCADPVGVSGQAIVGGQGKRVVLQSSDVHYTDAGSGVGDLTFKVQVRNISSQTLGYGSTGVRVFFEAAPVGVPGTITVEDDSTNGTFTAGGQHYYKYPGQLAKWDITPPLQWRFHMTGYVSTFTFNVLVAATVGDLGGVLRWEPVTGFDQRKFNDVAVSSLTDRMAVGNSGLTAHWDGTTWTTIPGIVSEGINSVVAVAPGRYYAATGGGAVLYFNGTVWSEIYRRADYLPFYAISAVGDQTITAVGHQGIISRFYAGAWSDADVVTEASGDLIAVSTKSDGSRVTAINGASGHLEVWTSLNGDPFILDNGFFFASLYPPANTRAVDLVYGVAGTMVIAYQDFTGGGNVGKVASNLFGGTIMLSDADITIKSLFVVGPAAVGFAFNNSVDALDRVSWIQYNSTPVLHPVTSGINANLGGAAMTDNGISEFVAVSGDQHLYEWNGSSWIDPQGPSTVVNPDLWGIGDTVWMADGSGNLTKVVDGVATSLPGYPGLRAIWGISSTNFVVSTADGLGAGDPAIGFFPILFNPGLTVRDLWAGPTTVFVVKEGGGWLIRYHGSFSGYFDSEQGSGVWGCDDDHAWYATESGNVYGWTSGALDFTPQVTSPNPLRAITGTSCTDVWAVGDAGAAYHFDGISWTDKTDPAGPYSFSVTMRGPGQAFVAGDAGASGLFSTVGGFQNGDIPTQGDDIFALWRTNSGQVYAAGPNLFLRGLR